MESTCADALTVLGFVHGELPDEDQLKQRFRRLALKHHPDKAGSAESAAVATSKFQEISEAYDVLREALQEDGTLPQDAWYDAEGGFFSHGWTTADADKGRHSSAGRKCSDAYYRDCVGRWGATEFGWRAYPRAQPQGPQPAHQEHPAFDYNRREYFRANAKDADRPPPPNLFVNEDETPVGAQHSRPPPPDMNFRPGWGNQPRKAEPPPNLDPEDQGQVPKPMKPPRMPAPEADDLLWSPCSNVGRAAEWLAPPDLGQEVQSRPRRIPAPPMGGYGAWQADPKVPLPEFERSVAEQFMPDLDASDEDEFLLPNLGAQVPTACTLKVPLPNF
mmetsp:Transcript_32826/g.60061  ORF Transcript_32826/g.60061 Transcript_32826/m.60061 type:complete len:332 (-) Transcript_32826:44-1039(-)